jgi:hypothetical protein
LTIKFWILLRSEFFNLSISQNKLKSKLYKKSENREEKEKKLTEKQKKAKWAQCGYADV